MARETMQRTYIMLKPDAYERKLMGEIIARIEQKNFKITAMRMFTFNKEVLKEHYSNIYDKPFYPEIEEFMMRGPVLGMIVEGYEVIAGMRKLMGATNWLDAEIGTIRGNFSSKLGENLLHGSDSPENAEIEIERFFGKNTKV